MRTAGFQVLVLAAALASGLVAGVFLAFSSFVMRGLAQLPPEQGAAAMRAINITVLRSVFMGLFLGLVPVCLFLLGAGLLRLSAPGSALLIGGSALYLLGTFGVTAAFNVPLNDALQAASPTGGSAVALWAQYLASWTAWNHLRTLAALGASALFTLALLRR